MCVLIAVCRGSEFQICFNNFFLKQKEITNFVTVCYIRFSIENGWKPINELLQESIEFERMKSKCWCYAFSYIIDFETEPLASVQYNVRKMYSF